MGALRKDQLLQYEREGYLLVSGLISHNISLRAEKAMWRIMEMDPNDPETWGPNLLINFSLCVVFQF